jgi:hypothetical protein
MELSESIAWIALCFLPMFGSMEATWVLGKKGRSFNKKFSTKGAIMKKVPAIDVPLRK